jgi:hypothetical protein
MSLINPYKKYDRLITFGCSFTHGHRLGEEGSWGFCLSKLLGCNHINRGSGGSSNYAIMNKVIKYCETHDMSNSCIGIQWSEITRREVWSEEQKRYVVFNLKTLDLYDKNKPSAIPLDVDKLFNNREFFEPMWFDLEENTIRTIQSMILLKNYLSSKNIDFIMFEGIGSIMDQFYPYLFKFPIVDFEDDRVLLKDNIRKNILSDNTFFTEYGPLMSFMLKHELFNNEENDGHPNMEFIKWWVNEIYNYLKQKNEKTNSN